MFNRRTQARVKFLLELLSVSYRFRKLCEKPADGLNRIVPEWLVFGTAIQIGYNWIYDNDIGALRTNRWQRIVGIGIWILVARRLFPRSEDEWRSFSLGGSIGRLCYRFWYGILYPVPTDDDN